MPQPGHRRRTATGPGSSGRPRADQNLSGGRAASTARCSRAAGRDVRSDAAPAGLVADAVRAGAGGLLGDAWLQHQGCRPQSTHQSRTGATERLRCTRSDTAPTVDTVGLITRGVGADSSMCSVLQQALLDLARASRHQPLEVLPGFAALGPPRRRPSTPSACSTCARPPAVTVSPNRVRSADGRRSPAERPDACASRPPARRPRDRAARWPRPTQRRSASAWRPWTRRLHRKRWPTSTSQRHTTGRGTGRSS